MLRGVAMLGLVALAACGSGQDPAVEGAGERRTSTSGVPEAGRLALSVAVPDDLVVGQPVTWRLTVANGSDDDSTLAFTTGQQGEVVLLDPDGGDAYRWSEGMMFAQALSDIDLPAGDEVTFDLPGRLEIEPGTYQLRASVPSDPAPEPFTTEVTVAG